MFYWRLIMLSLFLCCLSGSAQGSDALVISPDEDAIMRINPVMEIYPEPLYINTDVNDVAGIIARLSRQRPEPFSGLVDPFIPDGLIFFRFSVTNPFDRLVTVALTNEVPMPLRTVYLIAQRDGITGVLRTAGSRMTAKQEIASSRPTFKLELPPGTSDFFLGIKYLQEPILVQFSLRHEKNFARFERTTFKLLLCIFSCAGFIIFYHAVTTLFNRSRSYLWALLSGFSFTMVNGSLSGFWVYLPAGAREIIIGSWPLWLGVFGFALPQFCRALLDINRREQPVIWWLLSPMQAGAVGYAAAVWFKPAIASLCYIFCVIAGVVYITWLGAYKWLRENKRDGLYYSSSFVINFVAMLASVLACTGTIYQTPFWACIYQFAVLICLLMVLFAISVKVLQEQKNHDVLKYSLKGAIADREIDKVIAGEIVLSEAPAHQYVTILAIDIVGYSLIYRRMAPTAAFHTIKELFTELTQIIHSCGGIIDKSLGDGILAFFGYELSGKQKTGHESDAYRCAIALQNHALQQCIRHGTDSRHGVYPLRIGIHSSSVFIGNMGDITHYDFTLTGEGVALAGCFEASCEPFKVIIGSSTYAKLSETERAAGGFHPLLIPLKHESVLIEAYELDPFYAAPEQVNQAKSYYWQLNHLAKKDPRFSCPTPLIVDSVHGSMQIINFSMGGFCLSSTRYFARGTTFELDLRISDDDPRHVLVNPLTVEVVWGMSHGDGTYRHGVQLVGGNEKKRAMVLELLQLKVQQYAQAV